VENPQRPAPVMTRSQIILEVVSDMVRDSGWEYAQSQVQLRRQGDPEWVYTLFASDAPGAIHQVARREVDVAIANPSSVLTVASRGRGPFTQPVPLRGITVIPSLDWFGFFVAASTGLHSLADIKAQKFPLRVSLRAQRDHAVHLYVDEAFKAYGFTREDILAWGGSISYDRGLPADPARYGKLKTGEVNAIFDEAVTRFIPLMNELNLRLLPLEDSIARELDAAGFAVSAIPRSLFPNLDADVPAMDFSGWPIYTHAEADDNLIYRFCRSLDARKAIIPWQQARPLPLDEMCHNTPDTPLGIPLHPAAERYWREAGYL